MIFNPFAATSGRMVECGKNVIEAAIREDVKRIVMISRYIQTIQIVCIHIDMFWLAMV